MKNNRTSFNLTICFLLFLSACPSAQPHKADIERVVYDDWLHGEPGYAAAPTPSTTAIVDSLMVDVLEVGEIENGRVGMGTAEETNTDYWPVKFKATIKYLPALGDKQTRTEIEEWSCKVWKDKSGQLKSDAARARQLWRPQV